MKAILWLVLVPVAITACNASGALSPTPTPQKAEAKISATETETSQARFEATRTEPTITPTASETPTQVIPTEVEPISTENNLPPDLPENYSLSEYAFLEGENQGLKVPAIRNAEVRLIYIQNEGNWEKVYGNFIVEKGKDWVNTHESINEVLDACFREAQYRFGDVENFKPIQSEDSRSVPPSVWRGSALGGYALDSNKYSDFYGHFWFEGFFQVGTESDYILCDPMIYIDGNHQPHRLMGYFGEVMDNYRNVEVGGRAEDIGLSGMVSRIDEFIEKYAQKLKGREAIFPISLDIEEGLGWTPTYPRTKFTAVLNDLFLNYRYGDDWKSKLPEERAIGPNFSQYTNLLKKIENRQTLSKEETKILLPTWGFIKVPNDRIFDKSR